MSDDAAAYRRLAIDVFSEGNLDVIDEVVADDYVEHADVPPGIPPTRDGLRAWIEAIRAAFPDFRYEILHQFRDGDMHIGHCRAHATMTGEFMGMPPSNKSATWHEIHIGRMADGKLKEHWGVIDRMEMMEQLGFAPPPAGA